MAFNETSFASSLSAQLSAVRASVARETQTFASSLSARLSAVRASVARETQTLTRQPIASQTAMSWSSVRSGTMIIGSSIPTMNSKELAHRNTLPAGAIIGIILGICSLISLAILLVWLRRRRRRDPATHCTPNPSSITPSDVVASASSSGNASAADGSDARSINALHRQYLQNELRAAQEKITEIQNLERRAFSTGATSDARAGRLLRIFSTRSAANTESRPRDPEMVAQLREMAARIRQLEAQIQSPWAQGISDEPPPEYLEEEV